MNHVPRHDPHADEVARIRAVVARHQLPDFVAGFDVRLGEFDGDPALWITFKLKGGNTAGLAEMRHRAQVMLPIRRAIQEDLLETSSFRYPYFRSEPADAPGLASVA